MDGVKKVVSQLSSTASKGAAKSSPASTASRAAGSAAKANVATSAAVIQLNPGPSKSAPSEAPVRSYSEAKVLAKSIAERLQGDEHGDLTADTLKGLFRTQ